MIRLLYIDHNHITLLVLLLCMVNTTEIRDCRPVHVCHIRLPHFAAAIKSSELVSGIGYSTVPYFSPLGRFWYSLTPYIIMFLQVYRSWTKRGLWLPSKFRQVRLLLNTFNEWFIMTDIVEYILIGSYIQDWVLDIIPNLR